MPDARASPTQNQIKSSPADAIDKERIQLLCQLIRLVTGAAYGSYADLRILLPVNGFGILSGIPGSCVNPVDNVNADCSTPNVRVVLSFSIPDGASMTLPHPSTPLLIKALNAELRPKNLGDSAASPCATMPLDAQTLPTGGTHDPSDSSDSEYLGTKPGRS
jgi:hypothetical protein